MFGFGQNLFDAIFQENHILSRKIIEESRKGFEKKGFLLAKQPISIGKELKSVK